MNLERMRKAQPHIRTAATGADRANQSAAVSPVHRPKPPVVAVEPVTCVCGHVADFELFADKQDRFRDARRKKLAERPCPQCRMAAERQRVAEAQAAAPKRRHHRTSKSRLPDGAQFVVTYNAAFQSWGGHLLIGDKRFVAQAGGVFTLLARLDDQYRAALPREGSDGRPKGP